MSFTLYDPPAPLVGYIRRVRPNTPESVFMKTLREQWARIVDHATYDQLNDAMRVKRLGNGRLKVTFNEVDLNNTPDSIVFTPAYQSVTDQQATRWVQEILPWVEIVRVGNAAALKPVPGTSGLRVNALRAAVAAKPASWRDDNNNMRIALARLQSGRGLQVHLSLGQIVWFRSMARNVRDNLTTLMREALRRGRNMSMAVEVERHDTSAAFLNFIERRRVEITDDGPLIDSLPVLDYGDPTARTWGIEVEAAGARGVYEPTGWERKDDGSLTSAYDSRGGSSYRDPEECEGHDHRDQIEDEHGNMVENPDWVDPDYCDWVQGYYDEDYDEDTAEFVSPVLTKAGSRGLRELVDALSREPQNDTAGVHVHVGASDLTPKQIGALVFAYSMIEPIITPYYEREERGYCKEIPARGVTNAMAQSKRGERPDLGDRYFSVNLWALQSHGTIEFRAMGPVYRYDKLVKWALFCREMVSIAKAGTVPNKAWTAVKSWDDVERILRVHGPELQAHALGTLDFEPASFEQYYPANGREYAY
jgi:hypothetical protein